MSTICCENASQYASLLSTILSTFDNELRRQMENAVVRSLGSTQTANFLVEILQNHEDAGVRQLAAVLLRKRLLPLWRALSLEEQSQLKAVLLNLLGAEPHRLVRFSIAHVVALLAKAEAGEGAGWPELQLGVSSAMQSEDAANRELAMVLSYAVAEAVGDQPDFINGIGQAVCQGLDDSVVEVRLAALRAASAVLPFIQDNFTVKNAMIEEIIPKTLKVVSEHVANENSISLVLRTIDLLQQVVEDIHTKTHGNFVLQILEFMVSTMRFRQTNARIRESASEIVGMLVELKPKFLLKNGVAPILIECCLELLSEDETIDTEPEYDPELENEDDDEAVELFDAWTPCIIGGRLLDHMSRHFPSKHIFPLLMQRIATVTSNVSQASSLEKKGAILAVACISQGCCGILRRQLTSLLTFVQTLMKDTAPVVKQAAAFALTYFSEYLQPEILTHHEMLIPMLLQQLDDPNDNVRGRVAQTLDSLCENVGDNLSAHLSALLPKLIEVIPHSSLATQKHICSVISSVAQTNCQGFDQYAEGLLDLLKEPMASTDPAACLVKAKATEAVGIIAVAMGRERYSPYHQYFWGQVMESFHNPRAELKEQCFGFFANICEVLDRDFVSFVPEVLPLIIESLETDTATYRNKHLLAATNMKIGDDDAKVDEGEAEELHLRVRTADVEEKSSAINCLGVLAENLTDLFWQFIDQVEDLLQSFTDYYHDMVIESAFKALVQVAIARYGPEPFPKVQGLPVEAEPLPQKIKESVNELLVVHLIPTMQQSSSKELVAAACEGVCSLVEFYGSAGVNTFVEAIVCSLIILLRNCAPCQVTDDDDDDEAQDGEEIAADHDPVLDSVNEVVDALSKAYGAEFDFYFQKIIPWLLPYLKEDRPSEDLAMGTGTLASCLLHMKHVAAQYFNDCLPIAFSLIHSSDESAVRSNCCWLLRALIENAPQLLTEENLHEILAALWQVAAAEDEIPSAVDNAISAACSAIRVVPHIAPLNSLIPPILQNLPVKVDFSENENTISTVGMLLQHQPQVVDSHLAGFVSCCARIILTPTVDNSLKGALASSLQQYVQSDDGERKRHFVEIAATLHNRLQKALAQCNVL